MRKILLKLFPKYIKNHFYNLAAYVREEAGYSVFDEKGEYIPCEVGLVIPFDNGKVYKVTKMWQERPNSDWLYPSDCIQCNLKRIK